MNEEQIVSDGEGKKRRLTRKVIQIAIGHRQDEDNDVVGGDRLYALCDDGTIWYNEMDPTQDEWPWWTLHTVPQGPREDIGDAFDREGEEK
jgi:hypothetical protein